MPTVAEGVAVRWVATTASWLGDIGGDAAGTVYEPAILARAHLRYDEAKADLVHDVDHDVVLFPLDANIDPSRPANVAFADSDLLAAAPASAVYRLTSAPIGDPKTWKQVERGIIDHLVRTGSIELQVNKELKLYSRPDESAEDFQARCAQAAQAAADAAKAELSTKHEEKVAKLEAQLEAAHDRASVVAEQAEDRKRGNLLRAAGDLLGGLFGSRRSAASKIGSAADHLTRDADGERVSKRPRARWRGSSNNASSWTRSSPPSRPRSTPSGRLRRRPSRRSRSRSNAPTSRSPRSPSPGFPCRDTCRCACRRGSAALLAPLLGQN